MTSSDVLNILIQFAKDNGLVYRTHCDYWHTYTVIVFTRERDHYGIELGSDQEYNQRDLEDFKCGIAGHFELAYKSDTSRPSKDEYYLGIAQAVAKRSTCIRRQYGAVIVKDDRIISTGYNGSARGEDNCCDKGECWREKNNIPHGEQYEKCQAVHAEANAIINGNPSDMIGATLYLAGYENGELIEEPEPCMMCRRLITNAGIEKVINKF